ncbi:MAG: hypothetical protein AAGA90_09275 [Actinomycetota bacterium]
MVHGLSTCAHCGALLNGSVCAICGKSERDEVEVVEEAPRERGLPAETRRQLLGMGGGLVAVILVAVLGHAYLTRPPSEPEPLALATPTPTSSTTTVPAPTVQPPTIDRPDAADAPPPTIEVGAERSVVPSDGTNPWNGAPARNVLSGDALDNTDYRPGIEATAAVVSRIPAPFTATEPTQPEWNGIDLDRAEQSQPFAARAIADASGTITDVWVIARGPSMTDGSAAYVRQALETWPDEAAIDTFSPRPGVRLHQLTDDGTETIWLDRRDTWLVLYRAPSGTDPGLLGVISDAWN